MESLRPSFEPLWKALGINDLISLTMQPMPVCKELLYGALQFWSRGSNLFIFPHGAMSITLRDVVALTGLPITGLESPAELVSKVQSEDDALQICYGSGSKGPSTYPAVKHLYHSLSRSLATPLLTRYSRL